jgi:hypothetical protein
MAEARQAADLRDGCPVALHTEMPADLAARSSCYRPEIKAYDLVGKQHIPLARVGGESLKVHARLSTWQAASVNVNRVLLGDDGTECS